MRAVRALMVAAMTFTAALAHSGNFPYTYLGLGVGQYTPDEEIVFLGERYQEFAYGALEGSYQFSTGPVLGLSFAALSNSGPNTEITQSSALYYLAFPVALTRSLDLVPRIGLAYVEFERCYQSLCAKEDDSGIGYGADVRFWAVPGTLEVNTGWSDTTLEDSEPAVSFGTGLYLAERHRLGFVFTQFDRDTLSALQYSYHWR